MHASSSAKGGQMNIAWKEILIKGLATRAVADVAGTFIFGPSTIVVMGKEIPGVIPMALGAAGGCLAADLAHAYIFPLVPHNQKYDKMESITLSLAVAGFGTYAVASLFGTPALVPSLALGAGSFAAADWVYHGYLGAANGGSILF